MLLVNSDGATTSELNDEFKSADIVDYAYTPSSQSSGSWPTLQKLIDDNKRLVTFVASLEGSNSAAPYLMSEWDYIFENPYDVTSPANFSCTPDRPSSVKGDLSAATKYMPLMNHFLYSTTVLDIEYPNSSYVSTTNAPSGGEGNLGDAADQCKQAWGRQPTFILVDFADKGPAIDTVDKLNNVKNPVGRKNTTSPAVTSGASASSNVFKGLLELAAKAKSGANPGMGAWVWVGGDWGGLLGGGLTL